MSIHSQQVISATARQRLIEVNQVAEYVVSGTNILQLLEQKKIPQAGVAVALNQSVLPVQLWQQTELQQGDELDIFQVVAGG